MPHTEHLEKLQEVVRYHIAAGTPLDMSVFWHPCGTMGCVAGWAAHDPYFQDLGLQVLPGTYPGNGGVGNRQGVLILWRKRNGESYAYRDFDALKVLFDLDEPQCAYLFGDAPLFTSFERIDDWHDALSRIQDVLRGDV